MYMTLSMRSPWILQEHDETKFEELFNSIYKPLLDKKVEPILYSVIKYAQNEKD